MEIVEITSREDFNAFILTIFAGGTYMAPVLQRVLASHEMHHYGATHSLQISTLAKSAIHLENFPMAKSYSLRHCLGISASDSQLAQLQSRCRTIVSYSILPPDML